MKKIALTISLLAGATAAYAQSTINWSDYIAPGSLGSASSGGFYIEVFGGGTGGPGNTSSDLPGGTATYTGTPIGLTGGAGGTTGPTGYANASHYEIGLYSASTQAGLTAALQGAPGATATFLGGSAGNGAGAWDFGGSLDGSVTTVGSGNTAVWVELAAWYSGGGATTYAAAVTAGVPVGTSAAGQVTEATSPNAPIAWANTLGVAGINDFIVTTATPEPSTIALGVIGASAFLMRLRRKQ